MISFSSVYAYQVAWSHQSHVPSVFCRTTDLISLSIWLGMAGMNFSNFKIMRRSVRLTSPTPLNKCIRRNGTKHTLLQLSPSTDRDIRYNEIFFMIDTCQANTMYSKLYSPNILATGSSKLGENSYSARSSLHTSSCLLTSHHSTRTTMT